MAAVKVTRAIRRSAKGRALLTLDLTVDMLHEIEANARMAGVSLGSYCAAVLLKGDRACEHGVSILATGAAACVRCNAPRREVVTRAVEIQPSYAVRPWSPEGEAENKKWGG